MKTLPQNRRPEAFTLVELLTVIAIIAILAGLMLPVLSRAKWRAKRAWCENNLEQIGIAFNTFANDHGGKFPMAVSTNSGGSLEFVQAGFEADGPFYSEFRHFQKLGRELDTPKILICPTDTREATANFGRLQNVNVSYAVGVNAEFNKPGSILACDRNLATNAWPTPTILAINGDGRLWWTAKLHQFKGNLVFADGHVEEWGRADLASAANRPGGDAVLFLPSIKPGTELAGGGASSESGTESGEGIAPSGGEEGAAASNVSFGNNSNENFTAASGMGSSANSEATSPTGTASGSSPSRGKVSNQTRATPAEREAPALNAYTTPEALSGGTAASAGNDGMMSPFNRHLAGILQRLTVSMYLLLLLLCLLLAAWKVWRSARQEAERRTQLLLCAQTRVWQRTREKEER